MIDSHTNDVVIYNTGLSVASTGKRLLLPHESELVIAHGELLLIHYYKY